MMDAILQNYNLLIERYYTSENESLRFDIKGRMNILCQISPILATFKTKFHKIKNGEKAITLYENLHIVQVQISILEKMNLNTELDNYLSYLKEKELRCNWKIQRFTKRKKVVFPSIAKKSRIDKSKIVIKATKYLEKLDSKVHSGFIDDISNMQKLNKLLSKFIYKVEMLTIFQNELLENVNTLRAYQVQLEEISNYDILMSSITQYFMKMDWNEDEHIAVLEQDQNTLYETFIYNTEVFISDCNAVLNNKSIVGKEGSNMGLED